MSVDASQIEESAAPPVAPPADVVDRLHTKVTEICEAYFTSVGHLQSVAPGLPPEADAAASAAVCAEPAGTFAADMVRLHVEFDTLVGELEAEHRTEREQLDAMAALQARPRPSRGTLIRAAPTAHAPESFRRAHPLRWSSTRPTGI